MKHLSIRLKITLWFTAALVLVVLLTYLAVLSVSSQILHKGIRDNLIETVAHNLDEVEFYARIDDVDLNNDVDHFVAYGTGFLEVDDDFLDEVNQVYTALYREDLTLLYGENPISRATAGLPLQDARIQTLDVDGTLYYILDRQLSAPGLEGLWLRGVVSEAQGAVQMTSITRTALVLLPLLVLAASVGGWLIAGRMLRPIRQISGTARQIGLENDLTRRIDLGAGRDELHQLADSFNDMFDRLERAFEAERQFTADASHELRTPTSVILAQCELALSQPRDAAAYVEALELIQRQGRKLSALTRDMLELSRLDAGAARWPRTPLDLSALVDTVCADLALIGERGIALTWEADPGIRCCGNRELLTRLLSNLIGNAYRYGRENGHIQVRLTADGAAVRLSVADDGPGIPAEAQEKIFRRFYQGDSSRAGAGLGLGLPMAREIARLHGGTLTVESAPGAGSTFTAVLPR